MRKEIKKGKIVEVCDICKKVIPLHAGGDGVNIIMYGRDFHIINTCDNHRKELKLFVRKLKEEWKEK
jgi:hypothetical protein